MKNLFYFIYSIFFNIGKLFPLKEKLVALVSPHNASFSDSLGAVQAEIKKRNGFEFVYISGEEIRSQKSLVNIFRYFVTQPFALARAKYIFLNDNFMPLSRLNFKNGVTVTQLWHGEGAFKKSGFDLNLAPELEALERKVCSKYDYMICSSESVVPIYAGIFGMDKSRVLPLGSARSDVFVKPFDHRAARAGFDSLYPECTGKKLALYAPTFRDNPERDARLMQSFDIARFNEKFGSEYALLIRLHPQVHSPADMTGAVDLTSYPDIGSLLRMCDLLITDYSSVFMDFTLLNKPCLFYAPDLAEYCKERDFYGRYEDIVPGKIAYTFDELLEAAASPTAGYEKLRAFREYHLGACDGHSTERIVDFILG